MYLLLPSLISHTRACNIPFNQTHQMIKHISSTPNEWIIVFKHWCNWGHVILLTTCLCHAFYTYVSWLPMATTRDFVRVRGVTLTRQKSCFHFSAILFFLSYSILFPKKNNLPPLSKSLTFPLTTSKMITWQLSSNIVGWLTSRRL